MNKSDLIWGIAGQATLHRRIEALVRSKRWNDPSENVQADIPLGDLAWSIASNATIQQVVSDEMEAQPEEQEQGSFVIGVGAINDNDLEFILFGEGGSFDRILGRQKEDDAIMREQVLRDRILLGEAKDQIKAELKQELKDEAETPPEATKE